MIVSAPWDVTVSYGAGTAYAPDAIIEASTQLDFHEPLAPGAWRRGIATADVDYSLLDESQRLRGDAAKVIDHLEGGGSPEDDYVVRKICRVNEGCAAMNANIGAQAARWLDAGKLVGLVGGDHSTPYGLIRALGERHAEFGILHIDAHCDLRDAYEGFEFSHASITSQRAARRACGDEDRPSRRARLQRAGGGAGRVVRPRPPVRRSVAGGRRVSRRNVRMRSVCVSSKRFRRRSTRVSTSTDSPTRTVPTRGLPLRADWVSTKPSGCWTPSCVRAAASSGSTWWRSLRPARSGSTP